MNAPDLSPLYISTSQNSEEYKLPDAHTDSRDFFIHSFNHESLAFCTAEIILQAIFSRVMHKMSTFSSLMMNFLSLPMNITKIIISLPSLVHQPTNPYEAALQLASGFINFSRL
uniref:Uncharacterized protein n=1 Tax=Setaria viridis TaxID=4556 RepID=A0A4U6VEW2_SETVI|nr:hypothetical protein SEVIR_4G241000v2 [Setaria viridis]